MDEPTPEVIAHALATAKDLLRRDPKMTLARALAHATTTEQCRGYQGFAVYRDVRAAVAKSEGLDAKSAAKFTETTRDKRAVDAVEKAMKLVNA